MDRDTLRRSLRCCGRRTGTDIRKYLNDGLRGHWRNHAQGLLNTASDDMSVARTNPDPIHRTVAKRAIRGSVATARALRLRGEGYPLLP